jgi:hypothetical protein
MTNGGNNPVPESFAMSTYSPIMCNASIQIPQRGPAIPYASVMEFGADNTGKTESSDAINRALASLPQSGGDLIIPRGMYLIDPVNKGIKLRSMMRVLFEDERAVLKAKTNNSRVYGVLQVNGVHDCEIQGGTILGDRDTHSYDVILGGDGQPSEKLSTHEWGMCIQCYGSQRINFLDMHLEAATGDGISFAAKNVDDDRGDEPCEDIFVRNVLSQRNRRQGISIGRMVRGTVQKCEICDIGGTGPGAGIDVEPTSVSSPGWCAADIVIEDCFIHHNQSADVLLFRGAKGTTPIQNVIIRRNRFEYSNLGVQAVGAEDYFILANRITNCKASGVVLGKGSSGAHYHENTSGFNYSRQGYVDRPDFECIGFKEKSGMTRDILIGNSPAVNDIGRNFYI